MILVSDGDSAELCKPGETSFNFPAALVAAQGTPVLRFSIPVPVGCDQFNSIVALEPFIERVTVVSFVADDTLGQFVNKS